MSDFIEQAQARIRAAQASGTPLRIRGGGSKDFFGGELIGEVLDTRAHSGVIAYDPSELVLTVRAGTPLAEVEATLAASGQCLPFEPPHFGAGATVGGCVASGLSGPRRPYAGAVRDYLLGVSLIDGRGEALRFGGQVMKNVAGFDTFRLQAGAMGTLGLITEVSFKVLPRPEADETRVFESTALDAIATMNRLAGQPLPLAGAIHLDGRLSLRLAGNPAAVIAAVAKLGGEPLADAAAFWASIREQTHPYFAGDAPLWRLAVKPTAPPLAGDALIDWGGGLRWLRSAQTVAELRAIASLHGGHATAFRNGTRAQAFQPPAAAVMALHRRLKATFDPAGILNRGRLYPEL
ncbi:glycolate oxidase subunit GlcE [Nevskia sp.]|uniref:glycolate oxidase subunit GlcE n=1 Tax=Nevskia sp. TaxID=1929292 RepID=UPI0025CCB67E|nr:glycolate oxidase subunit GlcE [Nevskia sp.]